jgi:hypothetical protein
MYLLSKPVNAASIVWPGPTCYDDVLHSLLRQFFFCIEPILKVLAIFARCR